MKSRDEWIEDHWDVIALVAALLIALAVGAGLGVVYNVVAAGLGASRPPVVERRSLPLRLDADPVRRPAPLS
jgi:hypothetical protein